MRNKKYYLAFYRRVATIGREDLLDVISRLQKGLGVLFDNYYSFKWLRRELSQSEYEGDYFYSNKKYKNIVLQFPYYDDLDTEERVMVLDSLIESLNNE